MLREKPTGRDKPTLLALALQGGQLCSEGKLEESPLMRTIAEKSVEVYMARRRSAR